MARESQSPLGVYNPPPPSPTLPPARTTSFYWSLGCVPGLQWSIHVGILPQPDCCTTTDIPICYRIPPTYFPPYKKTTSLHDMLSSHGFLWRCLKATVPTMTLSLCAEALQCRGPVGYFPVNEAGCGMQRCQLSFTHFSSFTHKPHISYSHRPLRVALKAAADDYYRLLVTPRPCTVSISRTEDLPPPGKTHLDLIWGKICLLREQEEGSGRRSDCSRASAAWFNLATDSVSDHLYSSYFGRWVRVSAEEGETEGGEEREVFVYRRRRREAEGCTWYSKQMSYSIVSTCINWGVNVVISISISIA